MKRLVLYVLIGCFVLFAAFAAVAQIMSNGRNGIMENTCNGTITTATITFPNGETIDNAVNQQICLAANDGEAEELCFDMGATTNTVGVSTTTGVTVVDYGSIQVAAGSFDASEGNITNAGDIALDSLTADATSGGIVFGGTGATSTESFKVQFGETGNKVAITTTTGVTDFDITGIDINTTTEISAENLVSTDDADINDELTIGGPLNIDEAAGKIDFTGGTSGEIETSTGPLILDIANDIIQTEDNKDNLAFNIPVTGTDATVHVMTFMLDGISVFNAQATGDGAGDAGVKTVNIATSTEANVVHIGGATALVDLTDAHWSINEAGTGSFEQVTSTDDADITDALSIGGNFQSGSATVDTGTWTMIKGAQTSDPQMQMALSADGVGGFSITTANGSNGDIKLDPSGDDVHLGADDNAANLAIHSGGTLTMYDASDDTSISLDVDNGTNELDLTGDMSISSDLDVVDTITAGDIVIDEAAGVLSFSGATSGTISTTTGPLLLGPVTYASITKPLVRPVVTIADGDATPDVSGGDFFITSSNTGATAITDLDSPTVGQLLTICGGSNTNSSTIADSGNFNLDQAFTASLDLCLTLYVQADNDYIEIGRTKGFSGDLLGADISDSSDSIVGIVGALQMGSATVDASTFTMIKGAQTSDPQVQMALTADGVGGFSITTANGSDGDIKLDPSGNDIHLGADDNTANLAVHSGGTITIYDTSDDTSIVLDVDNGTTELDLTGSLSVSGNLDVDGVLNVDPVTIVADDTTPDVSGGNYFVTSANTGATVITDFDNPTVGQIIILCGGSATNSSQIADSGNFTLTNLYGSFSASVGSCITLIVQADNTYYELARSNNTATATLNASNVTIPSNGAFYTGAWASGGIILTNTADTVDASVLATGTTANAFIIMEAGDTSYDHSHAQQTNPTLFGHSAVQSTTQWWSLTHNQTDSVYSTGAGNIQLQPVTGKVKITADAAANHGFVLDGTTTHDTLVLRNAADAAAGDFTCNAATFYSTVTVDNITTGSDANSPAININGNSNSGGSDYETNSSIQLISGDDPYLRISVDDVGTAAGTNTPVIDIHDNVIAFVTDNTVDIGASGANRPKDGFFSGDITVGDTVSCDDAIISNTNGVLSFSGATSATISTTTADLILAPAATKVTRISSGLEIKPLSLTAHTAPSVTAIKSQDHHNATAGAGVPTVISGGNGTMILTGVTKANSTGDAITFTVVASSDGVATATAKTEDDGTVWDCDGAASDAACVCNLYAHLTGAGAITGVSVARTDGTCSDEQLFFYPTTGVAVSLFVASSDNDNVVIQANDNGGLRLATDGSATAPAIHFANDLDLGFYRSAANTLNLNGALSASSTLTAAGGFVAAALEADLTAGACTPGTWKVDTGGAARELCRCNDAGSNYDCISVTTAAGPTD